MTPKKLRFGPRSLSLSDIKDLVNLVIKKFEECMKQYGAYTIKTLEKIFLKKLLSAYFHSC